MKWKGGRRDGRIEDRRPNESQRNARDALDRADQFRSDNLRREGARLRQERGPLVIEDRNSSKPMSRRRTGLRPGATHTMGRR